MYKKNFAYLLVCLFFVAIIISACKGGKSNPPTTTVSPTPKPTQTITPTPTPATSNSFTNANVGDYIKLGTYPQTAEGEIQPIEWLVLKREGNQILLISKYGLEPRNFDKNSNNWGTSEIRQWLNSEFYNKAFSENEKKYIKSSDDNIFLLSKTDVLNYFANKEAIKCKPTEYAKSKGASVDDNGYTNWWLNYPDTNGSGNVYRIVYNGDFGYYENVWGEHDVARPALWITF